MEDPIACAFTQFFPYHFLSKILPVENYLFSLQSLYKQTYQPPQVWGKTQ